MRVETLYSDSSGTYRVKADIKENNRTVHIIDIRDDDYGTEADWDDFNEDEQAEIHNLLLEEYDAYSRDELPDIEGSDGDEDEEFSDGQDY